MPTADPRDAFNDSLKDGAEYYALEVGTLAGVALQLVQLLLTFVEPDEAKALIDQQAIIRANAAADAAVRASGLEP